MALLSVLLGLAVAYVFIVALVAVLWYDLTKKRKTEEVKLLERVLEELKGIDHDLIFVYADLQVANDKLGQLLGVKKPRTITLTASPAEQ